MNFIKDNESPEDNKLSYELELLEKFSSKRSEKEIIDSLDDIKNYITKKGKYSKIKKEILIKTATKLRKIVDKLWTKQVRIKFGEILKLIRFIEKISNVFDSFEENKECLNFKCFGEPYLSKIKFKDKIMKIASGHNHIILFSNNGSIYSYGKNSFGQLGIGEGNNSENNFTQIKYVIEDGETKKIGKVNFSDIICSGFAYNLLSINGKIYSFGAGENGRLGTGSEDNLFVPALINCDEMKKIVAGSTFTVALSEENELYSCGDKKYNGHGFEEDLFEFKKMDYGGQLFIDVSVGNGGYHTIALTLSGNVYTWGHNRVGQLGFDISDFEHDYENIEDYYYKLPKLINYLPPIVKINAGWGHSLLLSIENELLGCGRIDEHQFNFENYSINERNHKYVSKFTFVNEFNKNIKNIECGGTHSAVITNDNKVYLWGDNDTKQLCEDNIEYSTKPILFDTKLISQDNITIKNVFLSSGNTFILYN